MGMLGVLTDVTFKCEDWFNLRENVTILPLDYCLENFPSLSRQSDHSKLWIEAHSGVCALFEVSRTREPVTQGQDGSLWHIKVSRGYTTVVDILQ